VRYLLLRHGKWISHAWQGTVFCPKFVRAKKPSPASRWAGAIKGDTLKVSGVPSSFSLLASGANNKSGGYSMNNKSEKWFYSPQFSEVAAVSVRRLA
jgi:hypothetical protein